MTFFRARLAPPDQHQHIGPEEAIWRHDTERVHLVWTDAPEMVQLRPDDLVVVALRKPEGDSVGTYAPTTIPAVPGHVNRWTLHARMLLPVENVAAPFLVRIKPESNDHPAGLTNTERNSWYQAWRSGRTSGQMIVLFDHPWGGGRDKGNRANTYRFRGAPQWISDSETRACWSIDADNLDIVETPSRLNTLNVGVATVATPPAPAVEAPVTPRGASPQFTITDEGQRTAKLVLPDGSEWVRCENVAAVAMEYARKNDWCGEVRMALDAMGVDHQTETRWVVTVDLATQFELAVIAKNEEEATAKAAELVPGRLDFVTPDEDGDRHVSWRTVEYSAEVDD